MKKIAKFMGAAFAMLAFFSCSGNKEIVRSMTPAESWTLYLPGSGNKKDVVKDLNKAGWQVSDTVREHFSLVESDINAGRVLKLNTLDGKQDSIILPLSGNEKRVTVIFKAKGAVDPDNTSTPYGILYSFVQNGSWQTLLRHNASNQLKGSKGTSRLRPDDIVSDWHDFRLVFDLQDGPEAMKATAIVDGNVRHSDICKQIVDIETDINWATMNGQGNYLEFGDNDGSTNAYGRYAYILVVLDEDVSQMSLEELGEKVGADLVTNPEIKDSNPPSKRPENKPQGINIEAKEVGKSAEFSDPSFIEGNAINLQRIPVSKTETNVIEENPEQENISFAATVEPTGADGAYKTIKEAIDAVPSGSAIKVLPGFYYEKLVITKPGISLIGTDPTQTIIFGYEADTGGIDGNLLVEVNLLPSGTVTEAGAKSEIPESPVENCYFNAANITFYNKGGEWNQIWGGAERRSIALALKGVDKCYLKNCMFLGLQDTLYWRSGRVYAQNCFIQGTVDYICGGATVLFDGCEIHTIEYSNGGIISATAAADTGYVSTAEFANGYVFKNCKFTGSKTFEYATKKVTIARGTWVGGSATSETEVGKNVLIECELAPIFNPEPYSDWDAVNTAEKCFFREYKCTGGGASNSRAQLLPSEAEAYQSAEQILGFTPELL